MSEPVLLLCLGDGSWIALDPDELGAAQSRARVIAPTVAGRPEPSTPPKTAPAALLSAEAAAALLGVDASWLARAAREGAIPCVRLGKYVRFDPAAVVAHCTKAERSRP